LRDVRRLVAGVDGCRLGWVAVVGTLDASLLVLSVARRLDELIDRHPTVHRWAIDIPIGLPDGAPRECDLLGRRLLGKRRSTLFPAPPHGAVDAKSYEEACRRACAETGKRISKQAWYLFPKINETRRLLLQRPRLRALVCESHPELCFTPLNGGKPVDAPKKTPSGVATRRRLLTKHIADEEIARFLTETRLAQGVAIDDTLDAAALWTAASRFAAGKATELPTRPPTDVTGLAQSIVF